MKNKRWTENEFDDAVLMLKNGASYEEIAFKIKRSSKSVKVKLNKNGFSFIEESKIIIKCLFCNKEIETTRFNKKKFCNNSCAAKYNNPKRKKIKYCVYCNKELENKQKKFCNNKCQGAYKRNEIFNKIENGDVTLPEKNYKNYLIYKYGEKCMECGWNKINYYSGKIPVELEHIDVDSDNNKLNNLKLLCPNCHSLTPTWKGANEGKGRYSKRKIKRMKRYKEGKS